MKNMKNKLAVLGLAAMSLTMGGCAIHSVDEYGNDCVVGQTCPGLLTRKIRNDVVKNMTVIGVHKPGSAVWNNAIRGRSLESKRPESEIRAWVGERDFVQVRKMGFMFAINKHGGLYASGLNVGDTIDLIVGDGSLGSLSYRLVKRAGQAEASQN